MDGLLRDLAHDGLDVAEGQLEACSVPFVKLFRVRSNCSISIVAYVGKRTMVGTSGPGPPFNLAASSMPARHFIAVLAMARCVVRALMESGWRMKTRWLRAVGKDCENCGPELLPTRCYLHPHIFGITSFLLRNQMMMQKHTLFERI